MSAREKRMVTVTTLTVLPDGRVLNPGDKITHEEARKHNVPYRSVK